MKNPKILVPIDFSDLSKKALHIANEVAAAMDGRVTPFHSYIPITDLDGFHYMSSGAATQKNLTDIEDSLRNRLDDVATDIVDEKYLEKGMIGIGNPAHAIVEMSSEHDLIIMSTHGRTGFKRFLLGSVAEKVLRMADKPVMIVEDNTTFTPVKRILVTTDFSENAKAAFPAARAFAEATGADIELFHAILYDNFDSLAKAESTYETRKENINLIADKFFKGIPGKVYTTVITTNRSAHEAVLKHTQENYYSLIVMSTIGRTGLDYLMLGSTTSNVARMVKCAVLSVNPTKHAEMKRETFEKEYS
ncbi:MAG: universal stress protein [Candidatus Cyclonatronum sp.]|uniref:universal stress protein n=1 Tax=Cyclonatronum sp. TaxID=3024185 RepID=UPI0025BC0914|nr:universal stress protein [Cyclonatronum sp.]MCH8486309.1 universal stress protein [Cyclonatronum sp.]